MRYLVALALLAACGDPTAPPDANPLTPLAEWRSLWLAVEECSGMTGNFDRIRWFRSTDDLPQWHTPHTIYLPAAASPTVVKHEILHDLLQGDGRHGSPAWVACELWPIS